MFTLKKKKQTYKTKYLLADIVSCPSACILTKKLRIKYPVSSDRTPGNHTECDLFLPLAGEWAWGGEHTSSLRWNMVVLSEKGTVL